MAELPPGTVTLLFTDIEGSTRLLHELGRERYVEALSIHRQLVKDAAAANGGVEVEMQGDSFHIAFAYARDAVAAAAAIQRALAAHAWPDAPIRVRIGLHTGEPLIRDNLYAGLDVHRAARVMSVAHGGQVLISARTADLVGDELPVDLSLLPLGSFLLKDFDRPEALSQLAIVGLDNGFPPLKATEAPIAAEPTPRPRPRLVLLVALLVLAAAAIAVASVFLLGGSSHGSGPVDNLVAAIDPATGAVAQRVSVGNGPTQIAAGAGGVWVINGADGTLSKVDPRSATVSRTTGAGGTPIDLAAGPDDVWVVDQPNIVVDMDPQSLSVRHRLSFRQPPNTFQQLAWIHLEGTRLWVTTPLTLTRLDTKTLQLATYQIQDWGPVLGAGSSVWVSGTLALSRLTAATGTLASSLRRPQGALTAADGYLWVVDPTTDSVAQINPRTTSIVRTVPVGHDPVGIAVGSGSLWVACHDGTVARIDPAAGTVAATVTVGGTPEDIAFGFGRVWVSVA